MTEPRRPTGESGGPNGPPGSTPPSELRAIDHEIQFRTLVLLGLGIVVLTVLAGLGVFLLYQQLARAQAAAEAPPSPIEALPEPVAPGPRLEAEPRRALRELRRQEEEQLTSYQWVDPAEGLVRIPIDSAIDLLVERGLPAIPVYQPTAPAAAYLAEAGTPPPAVGPLRRPEEGPVEAIAHEALETEAAGAQAPEEGEEGPGPREPAFAAEPAPEVDEQEPPV